jgi:hypothetical protein
VPTAAQVRDRGDVHVGTFIIEVRDGNGLRRRTRWGHSSATAEMGISGRHLDWGHLEGRRAIDVRRTLGRATIGIGKSLDRRRLEWPARRWPMTRAAAFGERRTRVNFLF